MDTYSIEFTIEGLDKPTYDEIMDGLKNFKRFKDVRIYGSAGQNPKEPETVSSHEAEKEVVKIKCRYSICPHPSLCDSSCIAL